MSLNNKSFIFFGFAVPDHEMQDIIKKDKISAMQTHLFVWKLIYALEKGLGKNNLEIISTRPISDFPLNTQKIVRKKVWQTPKKTTEIGFINFLILKQITRFITSFIEGLRWLINNRKTEKKAIIVYSVHSPFMFTGYILAKISNLPLIGVWTDPPNVPLKGESKFKLFVRKWDYKFSKFLMRNMDASIVLTKYLAEDFNKGKPYLVVEAIADVRRSDKKDSKEENEKFSILYSGALDERYGIRNLINGFKKLPYDNVELVLYGRGDMELEIEKFNEVDKRIVYKGMKSNLEVINAQKKADVLVNPRPTTEQYTKYSFPSKTLEYMLTGTPVITTKLSGIPSNYFEYVYCFKDSGEENIYEKLDLLYNLPKDELITKGEKARKFAITKSIESQGEKIGEFINAIVK